MEGQSEAKICGLSVVIVRGRRVGGDVHPCRQARKSELSRLQTFRPPWREQRWCWASRGEGLLREAVWRAGRSWTIVCFWRVLLEAVGGEIAGCQARWNACRL